MRNLEMFSLGGGIPHGLVLDFDIVVSKFEL